MSNPVITVAMPFFDSAATLELAVLSVLNQSNGDFELLLCDDGSEDHSLAIAQSFHDPRVICWSDGRRLRLPTRLNECIDLARGQYLARMDADDIAYPDRLARQLAFLTAHAEVDLCGGGATVFGRRGPPALALQSGKGPCQDHALALLSAEFPCGIRFGWGTLPGFAAGATTRARGWRRIRNCCCAATGLAASQIFPRSCSDIGGSGSPSRTFLLHIAAHTICLSAGG